MKTRGSRSAAGLSKSAGYSPKLGFDMRSSHVLPYYYKDVVDLINYNPKSGALTWKERTDTMFADGISGISLSNAVTSWNEKRVGDELSRYSGANRHARGSDERLNLGTHIKVHNHMFPVFRVIKLLHTGTDCVTGYSVSGRYGNAVYSDWVFVELGSDLADLKKAQLYVGARRLQEGVGSN